MAVYVDKASWPYGQMVMCHMLADSLDELHNMAAKIGVKRKWFQPHATPHYDICKSKRRLAIAGGAIEIDRHQTVALIRRFRSGE